MAWAIARRDLHRRFRGLRLLLVCLFLGVGALAAIGSLTSAIRGELDSQGQAILGGDIEVEVWQRLLSEEEKAFLARYGTLSDGYRMQAMARAGEATAPVELKAIDARWPLYGTFTLADGRKAGSTGAGRSLARGRRCRTAGPAAGRPVHRGHRDANRGRHHRRGARPTERRLPAWSDGDRRPRLAGTGRASPRRAHSIRARRA